MTTSSTASGHLNSDPLTLDKNAIVTFASRFDPQPYHLDAEAAEQSIFGGLCASGWHIAALATRLVSETLLQNGHPFVEMISVSELKWSRPTFVNEQISVRIALDASLSESPIPDTRAQSLQIDVFNGEGAVVAQMSATAAISAESALEARP